MPDVPTSIRPRQDSDLAAVVAALAVITATDGYPGYPPRDPAAWLSRPDLVCAWVAERTGAADPAAAGAEVGDARAEVVGARADVGGARADVGGARAEVGGARAGAIVGHVSLRQSTDHRAVDLWCAENGRPPDECVLLARLFVVPPARGAGLGRELVAVACAEAARRGQHPVLDVADDGHAAIRLYERLGWVKLGSYEQPHRYRPTEYLHCYAAPPPS